MDNFTAFADRPALMQAAAARMAQAMRGAIAARGEACLALSGGSTPEPAYSALADTNLDWTKVTLTLIDERFVPPEDDASNEKLIQRAFAPAFARGLNFKPLFSATSTAAQAAERADLIYARLHFDLAVMGMGADAHTASWFPGVAARALDVSEQRSVIDVYAAQAAGAADRLTLTRSAYNRASAGLLLVTGEEKRQRLAWAVGQPLETAPVAALFAAGAPPLEIYWAP